MLMPVLRAISRRFRMRRRRTRQRCVIRRCTKCRVGRRNRSRITAFMQPSKDAAVHAGKAQPAPDLGALRVDLCPTTEPPRWVWELVGERAVPEDEPLAIGSGGARG